jgi:hypothetical protein
MAPQNDFSAITSKVSNFFGFLFRVEFVLVLVARIFRRRKVFGKILVGGNILFFIISWPTRIFP